MPNALHLRGIDEDGVLHDYYIHNMEDELRVGMTTIVMDCPCGKLLTSASVLQSVTTPEYKDRCLTSTKSLTDERKAPGV